MKRLMHRFLWMVLRSLCRPRKKQKVKMLMVRQTRDTTIPTRVMTVNSSSCVLLTCETRKRSKSIVKKNLHFKFYVVY